MSSNKVGKAPRARRGKTSNLKPHQSSPGVSGDVHADSHASTTDWRYPAPMAGSPQPMQQSNSSKSSSYSGGQSAANNGKSGSSPSMLTGIGTPSSSDTPLLPAVTNGNRTGYPQQFLSGSMQSNPTVSLNHSGNFENPEAVATAVTSQCSMDPGMLRYGSHCMFSKVCHLVVNDDIVVCELDSTESLAFPRNLNGLGDIIRSGSASDRVVVTFAESCQTPLGFEGDDWKQFFRNTTVININGHVPLHDLKTMVPNLKAFCLYFGQICSTNVSLGLLATWIPSMVTDFVFDARYLKKAGFLENIDDFYSNVVLKENPRRGLLGLPPIGLKRVTLIVRDFASGPALDDAIMKMKTLVSDGGQIVLVTEQRGDNKILDLMHLIGFRRAHQGFYLNKRRILRQYDFWSCSCEQNKTITFGFRVPDLIAFK